jgi:hypothetical protein
MAYDSPALECRSPNEREAGNKSRRRASYLVKYDSFITKESAVENCLHSDAAGKDAPRRVRKKLVAAAAGFVVSAALTVPMSAQAVAVSVDFDTWISGTPIGVGNSIGTLEISDTGIGVVDFKFTNTVGALQPSGLWQPNTGIKSLHLAYDANPSTVGILDGTGGQLSFTNLAGSDGWSIPEIDTGFRTNASYEFNIHFQWLTSNSKGGTKRFTDNEWFSWSVTSLDPASPLSIRNFLTAIDPPDIAKPPSIGLAHVFSLTDGSTKEVVDLPPRLPETPVSEPGTVLLVGSAFATLIGLRRRRTIATIPKHK